MEREFRRMERQAPFPDEDNEEVVGDICLRSQDDTIICLSESCANQCSTLSGMMEMVGTPDSAFPVPVSGNTLRRLVRLLNVPGEPSIKSLLELQRHELFAFGRAVVFLGCEEFLPILGRSVANLFKGKSAAQIRKEFDIVPDLGNAEISSIVREPLLSPPCCSSGPDNSNGGMHSEPPARWQGVNIGDEETILMCLQYFDAGSLRTLKTVSKAWRERARQTLGDPSSQWRSCPVWASTVALQEAVATAFGEQESAVIRLAALCEVSSANPIVCLPAYMIHPGTRFGPGDRALS
jgi:hypothetical protein